MSPEDALYHNCSVDPNQLASSSWLLMKPAGLDLHCFTKRVLNSEDSNKKNRLCLEDHEHLKLQ